MRAGKSHYQSLSNATEPNQNTGLSSSSSHRNLAAGNSYTSAGGEEKRSLRKTLRDLWPFSAGAAAAAATTESDVLDHSGFSTEIPLSPADDSSLPRVRGGSASGRAVPASLDAFLDVPRMPSAGDGSREQSQSPQDGPSGFVRQSSGASGPRWMPDEKCTVCFECGSTFNAWRRRHHCRLCGQIFCNSCSSHFVDGKLIGRPKEQQSRLCVQCTKHCDGMILSTGSSRAMPGTPGALAMLRQGSSPQTSASAAAIARVGSERAVGSEWRSHTQDLAAVEESDRSLGESGSDLDGSQANELDTRSNPSDGSSEALEYDHSHLESGSRLSLQSEFVRTNSQADLFPGDLVNVEPAEFYTQAPPVQHPEIGLPADAYKHLRSLTTLELVVEQPTEANVAASCHEDAWRNVSDASLRHFVRSVRACCQTLKNGLEDPVVISSICELARQVVSHINPGSGDAMDILSYVKIKRIPGGSIEDSQWVDGVVFSRDVAHRKMSSSLSNCNIALLGDSLSFDHENRHTHLDELRKQEATFFNLQVDKIADLTPMPDVLLCQGGISQMAQKNLRDRNISLVLGVPPHILTAVERCTGAKVLPSVASIQRFTAAGQTTVVGHCRHFTVQHTGDIGSQALTIVEGQNKHRCCTICLRGGGAGPVNEASEFLSQVKRVLQWAIRLARHLQLESELLFETWCEPRPLEEPDMSGVAHTDAEYLDLLCYSVSGGEDRSCSRPVMLRFPPYVLRMSDPEPRQFQAEPAWAGGLDTGCASVRDVTLHEWLTRCFMPDQPAGTMRALPQQSGCFPTPGGEVRGFSADTFPGASSDRFGVYGNGLSASSVNVSSSTFCLPMGRSASPGEAPVPSKGEVLCFQHFRSRIVVELRDHEEVRPRTASEHGRGVSSRWAQVRKAESEKDWVHGDSIQGDSDSGGRSRPEERKDFEVWRWCKCCKAQVTPRTALPSTASWLSFTKFLEMLLHNSTSKCPLAGNAGNQCPHAAFRDHVLFFASPQRPMVVGFKWEPAYSWQLLPPNLPMWDPKTRQLEVDPNPPEEETPATNSQLKDCEDLVQKLHDLLQMINNLVGSILQALSVGGEEESDTLTGARGSLSFSRGSGNSASVADSLSSFAETRSANNLDKSPPMSVLSSPSTTHFVVSSEGQHHGQKASSPAGRELVVSPSSSSATKSGPVADSRRKAQSRSSNLPPWLEGWVWANKGSWHNATRQLAALHAMLRECLNIARNRLRKGGEADSVVVAFTLRDLQEALGDNPPWLRSATTEMRQTTSVKLSDPLRPNSRVSVRENTALLSALRKLRSAPRDDADSPRHEDEEPRGVAAFPLPHAISTLAEVARRKSAALLGWASEPEVLPQAPLCISGCGRETWNGQPGQSCCQTCAKSGGSSHDDYCYRAFAFKASGQQSGRSGSKRSSRSRSLVRRTNLRTPMRSISSDRIHCEARRQRSSSEPDCASNNSDGMDAPNDIWSLPQDVRKVFHALEDVLKFCLDDTALPRGVHNLTMPVSEEDVGSIISYALLNSQVHEDMEKQWADITGVSVDQACCRLCSARGNSGCGCFFSLPASLRKGGSSGASQSYSSAGSVNTDSSSASNTAYEPTSPPFARYESCNPAFFQRLASCPWKRLPEDGFGDDNYGRKTWEDEWEHLGVRNVLTSATPPAEQPRTTVKLEFQDPSAKYAVYIHHAPQFHMIRHWVCGDDLNFVRSLSRCKPISTTGGKSGATFFITNDRRFLVKAVNKAESKLLTSSQAEFLFWYADQVLFDKLPSVLAQVVGVFTVSVKRRNRSKDPPKRTFIVQRNLRSNLMSRPHSCFDLKGLGKHRRLPSAIPIPEDSTLEGDDVNDKSMDIALSPYLSAIRNDGLDIPPIFIEQSAHASARATAEEENRKAVLWDQNFREWTQGRPLALPSRDLKYLEAAVWNDAMLLSGQTLIDYSLLLAAAPADDLDPNSPASYGTLAVGIIDYLRPYTWDKQVETLVKTTVHAGVQPTVIEPADYSKRFRNAMGTFFVAEAR